MRAIQHDLQFRTENGIAGIVQPSSKMTEKQKERKIVQARRQGLKKRIGMNAFRATKQLTDTLDFIESYRQLETRPRMYRLNRHGLGRHDAVRQSLRTTERFRARR